jgi:NDP-sugar pyrophosphorylase family protein
VRRIVRWLAASGVDDVVVNLHHRPETITRVIGDGRDLGVCVRYSWEQPEVLGSAGGPRLALPIIGASPFLLINGDTLTDIDLEAFAADHLAHALPNGDAVATLALIPNREPLRYGGVLLDGDSRVTGFARRGPGAVGSLHLIGVQAVNADAFAWLPPGQPFNSVGYAYDRLIAEYPGCIRGLVTEAAFHDIGTVDDYVTTCRAMGSNIGERVRIAPSASVSNSILWDDIEVGERCTLEDCIVTDHVTVAADAVHKRVILMNGPEGTRAVPIEQT